MTMTAVPEEKAAVPGDVYPEAAASAVQDQDHDVLWPSETLSLPR